MFGLLRFIIRPSNELTQDYVTPNARWDLYVLSVQWTATLLICSEGTQHILTQ